MQPETTLNGTPAAAARHRRTGVPISQSTDGWRRFRRTLTVGLFTVTTVAGSVVGLAGADVSPVAPAVEASAASVVSAPVLVPHHGHRGHR